MYGSSLGLNPTFLKAVRIATLSVRTVANWRTTSRVVGPGGESLPLTASLRSASTTSAGASDRHRVPITLHERDTPLSRRRGLEPRHAEICGGVGNELNVPRQGPVDTDNCGLRSRNGPCLQRPPPIAESSHRRTGSVATPSARSAGRPLPHWPLGWPMRLANEHIAKALHSGHQQVHLPINRNFGI